ncbi:hypothetical protein ACFQHO_10795 [Actinomadura yumaensis]|uniref:hypothetical protein n=1 Tax=Actinomadura yumaensis TaxID=111807 RepID=UPI0036107DA2
MTFTKGTEHDREALRAAREFLDEHGGAGAAARVHELVRRNGRWRGQKCVNLIAAESPTSPAVRALLSSEIGTRASGGHIGADSRCFPGCATPTRSRPSAWNCSRRRSAPDGPTSACSAGWRAAWSPTRRSPGPAT